MKKYDTFLIKLLPIIVLALGVLLRVVCLGSIPGGYHRDEAYGAWNALSLYKDGIDSAGQSYPVYFEAWAHGQNALNSYLMLPLIWLFGGHVTPVVVRIPQVIVALSSIVAVYFLMKKMYSRKIGILAMFLVTICPWHVMMSRWGLESNLAPGFLIIGLCFGVYGLEKPRLYILSALAYGLSLYCYATIWPMVPVMIVLQLAYGFWHGKLSWNRALGVAGAVLVALGLPLVLFLLVNMGMLPDIKIGYFSIYKMTSFRASQLAGSFGELIENFRNVLYMLKHQDIGRPYDVIMPYGFFYEIGRVFAVLGVIVVVIRSIRACVKKEFSYDIFLLIQLIGAGIVGCLIKVAMTQINCLYIPMVMCEAVGICWFVESLGAVVKRWCSAATTSKIRWGVLIAIIAIYTINLCGFQKEYYSEYKKIASAHFQEGADDAVRYAWKHAMESGSEIFVEAGLKYPNVLLATETGAKEYLDTVVYSENLPAPEQFACENIIFHMGIDFEDIDQKQIYVLYYTDVDKFEEFTLTKFEDWYVAIPGV